MRMLLRLDDILPEGIEVKVRLDPDDPAVREMDIKGPVTGSFHIRKIGRQLLVSGHVTSEVRLRCARCLGEFDAEVREKVDIELRPIFDLERSGHEMELGTDDLDVEFFKGDTLDLSHIAAEQIALAIPMKPLCREDCTGICSECGADLREGPCQCPPKRTDSQWNKLLRLKEQMEKKKG
jgi:uncharacterized protein